MKIFLPTSLVVKLDQKVFQRLVMDCNSLYTDIPSHCGIYSWQEYSELFPQSVHIIDDEIYKKTLMSFQIEKLVDLHKENKIISEELKELRKLKESIKTLKDIIK